MQAIVTRGVRLIPVGWASEDIVSDDTHLAVWTSELSRDVENPI